MAGTDAWHFVMSNGIDMVTISLKTYKSDKQVAGCEKKVVKALTLVGVGSEMFAYAGTTSRDMLASKDS